MADESLINIKKAYLHSLYNKFSSAYAQLGKTLNEADKPSIQLTLNELEADIQKLREEIKKLELESSQIEQDEFYKNCFNTWKENFPKIDFDNANKILTSILGQIENEEGAALFLLQNSRSMGGNLCINNIKYRLQNMGNLYPPCECNFSAYQQANEISFLNYLAQKFVIDPPTADLRQSTQKVIEKICGSLCSGNILFIQVDIYYLNPENQFLTWFVHEFWCLLVRQLPELSKKHRLIRFVAVLTIGGEVLKDCLPESLSCEEQKFDPEKFLELPLQMWEEDYIKNWLFKFSGLTNLQIGCTPDQIEQMARMIHQVTKGEPSKVYNELMDQMTRLVS